MTEQLSLSFEFAEPLSFDNFFLVEGNREIVKALKQLVESDEPQMLFLWGTPGSGKSHLAQSLCHLADSAPSPVKDVYVPLGDPALLPGMLEALEQYPLIILEDVDSVLGQDEWEEALFHLYNRIKEVGGRCLITSSVAPASMTEVLPDLRSRFGWGLVYALEPLNDADKFQALKLRAKERGLSLPFEVGQYLLNRLPRDTHELFAKLETLDKQSLKHQRALTIPFVKQVLKL